jgi:hypothetical protein
MSGSHKQPASSLQATPSGSLTHFRPYGRGQGHGPADARFVGRLAHVDEHAVRDGVGAAIAVKPTTRSWLLLVQWYCFSARPTLAPGAKRLGIEAPFCDYSISYRFPLSLAIFIVRLICGLFDRMTVYVR